MEILQTKKEEIPTKIWYNEFTKKQDKTTAWNTTNLVVGTQQPEIPENGYIIWIDTNS